MTITYRDELSRDLTPAEVDENFRHALDSSNQSYTASGSGATARTVQDRFRDALHVTDFMTAAQIASVRASGLSPSVDVTSAIVAAIAAAETSNLRTVYFPAGSYLVTSTISVPTGFTLLFAGVGRTIVVFTPTAADTLFEVSAGASINYNTSFLGGFRCYSADTTYVKIALDLVDVSSFALDGILVDGAFDTGLTTGWHDSTNGSIGIRIRGREASVLRNLKLAADKPITVAANPNTSATDGEDCDHFHLQDQYLIGYSNPLIEVAAGLGVMEFTCDGYQAWVGGTTGFKINDNRSSPTVASRGLRFFNVRREQGTSSSAYVFDCTFSEPVQNIEFDGVLMATGSNGIKLDGFTRATLTNVTAAMTSTQLLVANVTAKTVLSGRGCIWQSTGTFTTTGLTLISAPAYRSADYAAPSDFVYAGQITDTSFNVAAGTITCANGATGLTVTGTTGDKLQVNPQAAGSGAQLRIVNNGGTDFEPMSLQAETFDFRYRTGAGTVASSTTIDTTGAMVHALRHQQKQGAVLTAANNLTLGSDGNYFQVDGATQINLILNTNWQGGSVVTLKFNSTPTVKHNQAASGNNKPILLAGAADFVASASDTLTLRYDSTDSAWYEMSRAVI